MKVAWICEYPAAAFPDRAALRGAPASHPVPWIAAQAPLVAASGIELHVVTLSRYARADDVFARDGVHFHFLRIPAIPRALLAYQWDRHRLQSAVREIQPDLVHGFGTESSFGYAAVSAGRPNVLMIQGIVRRIVEARGWHTLLRQPGLVVALACEWLTVRRASHIVCETAFAEAFVRACGSHAATHLIRTPIRDLWFAAPAPRPSSPRVLCVGWVVPAKGVDVLVTAFAHMAARQPTAVLDIVGPVDAAYRATVLQPALERSGLAARVHFHGGLPPEAIVERMRASTVLALPTRMDTAPNVLAEARAAGLPVVATRVGGIPEFIEDGQDGVLVPVDDPRALADALTRLIEHPSEADAIAARGQARARRDHRLATQVPKLLALYDEILAAGAQP